MKWPRWRIYVLVIGGVVIVDLATKAIAHGSSIGGPLVDPVQNDELALGLASFDSGVLPLVALTIATAAVLAHGFKLSHSSTASVVGYSLLVGGALSNAIDRALTGSVHDWINLGVAVPNIADFALLIGLCWYATAAWRSLNADGQTP